MRSYDPLQTTGAYPVKTFDGAPDGLVTLARLAQVPQAERRVRRVRDFGTAMDQVAHGSPGEPLAAVLDRFATSDDGQILVLHGRKPVGPLPPTRSHPPPRRTRPVT